MHPEVTDTEPASVPEVRDEAGAGRHSVPGGGRGGHAHGHEAHDQASTAHDHADGLEWEDLMPEINRQTNRAT